MQNEITVVFGRKRTRKTRWAIRELKSRNRNFYIDPKSADLGRPEYKIGIECRGPAEVRDLTERGSNFCVRIPTADEDWIDLICKQALFVGECTITIDEVQLFSDPYKGSIQGIYDVLRAGGAAGVSFIGIAHRPTDVEIDLLAAADRIIIFQTTHATDIKRLQHYISAEDESFMDLSAPDESDPMRKSEYLEWRVSWGRRYEVKTFNETGRDVEVRRVSDSGGKKQSLGPTESEKETVNASRQPIESAGSQDDDGKV